MYIPCIIEEFLIITLTVMKYIYDRQDELKLKAGAGKSDSMRIQDEEDGVIESDLQTDTKLASDRSTGTLDGNDYLEEADTIDIEIANGRCDSY